MLGRHKKVPTIINSPSYGDQGDLMRSPSEFNDHLELALYLLEVATQERLCITELDIEGVERLANQRGALARRAVELAKEEAVPPEAAKAYRQAHRTAARNHEILRSARATVTTMLDQIAGRESPTYSPRGRNHSGKATKSVLVWKG